MKLPHDPTLCLQSVTTNQGWATLVVCQLPWVDYVYSLPTHHESPKVGFFNSKTRQQTSTHNLMTLVLLQLYGVEQPTYGRPWEWSTIYHDQTVAVVRYKHPTITTTAVVVCYKHPTTTTTTYNVITSISTLLLLLMYLQYCEKYCTVAQMIASKHWA